MKKIIYIAIGAIAALVSASCSDLSTEGVTGITYYATITLEGDDFMIVPKGTSYVEPGFSAILNGEDVTDQVTVSEAPDTEKSGVYTISYSYTNVDGFTAAQTRTVAVFDTSDPVEGMYAVSPDSYRVRQGTVTPYGSSFDIIVLSAGDGTYVFDDLLAGWYYYKAGYGIDYALGGTVSVAPDGTMGLIESYLTGWGDSAESLEGSYDSATSTFTYCVNYASMDFNVTMTKL